MPIYNADLWQLDDEESGPQKKKLKNTSTDEFIDVTTVEKISYFSSDSEDDLLCIPIKIEPDPRPPK